MTSNSKQSDEKNVIFLDESIIDGGIWGETSKQVIFEISNAKGISITEMVAGWNAASPEHVAPEFLITNYDRIVGESLDAGDLPVSKLHSKDHEVETAPDCTPNATGLFFLALMLKPEDRESLIGDVEERYHVSVAKWGRSRANILFWSDVARTLAILVFRAARIPFLLTVAGQLWSRVYRLF